MQTSNYNIFNTCPYTNGAGVFIARGLYASFNPAANYNDLLICIPELGSFKNGGNPLADEWNDVHSMEVLEKMNKNQLSIYPNPTSGNLKIVYKLESNQSGQLEVLDLTGKIVKNITLSNNTFYSNINLESLQNGFYIYNYIVDGRLQESGKINIAK
ncbi:MAG: Secretion system C-terminal sorting domain [Bacteroidota bacterium]|jgi:hypothetical protein